MRTLSPEIQAHIEQEARRAVDAAVARAFAHEVDPRTPMAAGSLEAVLHRKLRTVADTRRADLVSKVSRRPVPPKAAPVSLSRNVAALRPAIERAVAAAPQGATPSLLLEAQTLTCVRDSIETGADDMALAAFFVDVGGGVVLSADAVNVGGFRQDDVRTLDLPPLTFRFQGPIPFPHTFLAVVCLAEKDHGGFDAFIGQVLEAVTAELAAPPPLATSTGIVIAGGLLAAILGGAAAATMSLPPVAMGLAIATLIVTVITYVAALVAGWLEDELFPPATQPLVVESATSGLAQGDVQAFQMTFRRSVAEYRLAGRFRLAT